MRIIIVILVLLNSFSLHSQTKIKEVIARLESGTRNSITGWKHKNTDISDAYKIDFDDSDWETIRYRYNSEEEYVWLRSSFTVPEVFAATKADGKPLNVIFDFGGIGEVEGEIFINGDKTDSFSFSEGKIITYNSIKINVSDFAVPGKNINLAIFIRNIDYDKSGAKSRFPVKSAFRFNGARFQIEGCDENLDKINDYIFNIRAAELLLDKPMFIRAGSGTRLDLDENKSKVDDDKYDELSGILAKAVGEINMSAFKNGETNKFFDCMESSYTTLTPIAEFAKTYTLYLTGNSHIDLAWLWRWMETVEVTRATFSTIMQNMDEYPDIIYAQSQAHAYKWMKDYYPEVFSNIKERVKQGRWEIVGGMWAEPDCNLIGGESWIRQILYGKRYFRDKFGVDVKLGWNPDSFGYNWNMPQFFSKSGINAFITQKISWNDTNVFPYYLFWWKAPDGSKILVYFPPGGYVGRLQGLDMLRYLKNFEAVTGRNKVLVLYGLGDHGGGPNREMLDRLEGYKHMMIYPNIVHTKAVDFINLLRQEGLDDIPEWNDELYLEYHRGTYTTQAETKKNNRLSEIALSNTEKLSSITSLFGEEYNSEEYTRLWEIVLFNQFHDILPGSSINPVYKDTKGMHEKVLWITKNEIKKNLLALGTKIDINYSDDQYPVLVFNPLSWERTGIVELELPEGIPENVIVLDNFKEEIPSQIETFRYGKKRKVLFTAENVPSIGYKVYYITKRSSKSEYKTAVSHSDLTIENEFYRVSVNPETGNIAEIYDKENNRNVLPSGEEANVLQLLEDIPDHYDAWNIQYTGRTWELNKAKSVKLVSTGPVKNILRIKKEFLGGSKARRYPTEDYPSSFFTQDIILYNGIKRIDCKIDMDWWEEHLVLKAAFPVDVYADKATYEIPYGHISRSTGNETPEEKARYEVSAHYWADLSEGDYGISLLNNCKYGHDIKGNIIRLTLLKAPLSPDPMADRGKSTAVYSLYPHGGDWKEALTVQKGYELNYPLISTFFAPEKGRLPAEYSFFSLKPANLVLTTVKKREDDGSLIIRIYESAGKDSQGKLEFFKPPKRITSVDFMENVLKDVSSSGKILEFQIGKNEIKSFRIEF